MKNLFDVEGKIALVTGGSRGIGLMIAQGFVENGVKTYISSRKKDVCDEAANQLSLIGSCISIPADLSDMQEIARLATEIRSRESQLDILVNNAGATWGAPIDDFPENGWDKVMNLNVKSPFFLTQKLLPLLRASGSFEDPARIVNIGSVDGLHAPAHENYSYNASKAGIHHLTTAMAKHLAKDNINVNAVAPGPFETKMMVKILKDYGDDIVSSNPRGRIGHSEDMAGATIFLSCRASAYVTGAVLPVDGGAVTTL